MWNIVGFALWYTGSLTPVSAASEFRVNHTTWPTTRKAKENANISENYKNIACATNSQNKSRAYMFHVKAIKIACGSQRNDWIGRSKSYAVQHVDLQVLLIMVAMSCFLTNLDYKL